MPTRPLMILLTALGAGKTRERSIWVEVNEVTSQVLQIEGAYRRDALSNTVCH